MALLGFVIPFLGIGSKPAIVMVVLYSLLPIVKNTYTGQPIEGANSLVYGFKPAKTGEHTLTFTVKYDLSLIHI